jgi:hypothetical protein
MGEASTRQASEGVRVWDKSLQALLEGRHKYEPEDKVLLVYLSNTEYYYTYLKIKRTNLGSSGRGTTGLYMFSRWSVYHRLVYVQ